MLYGKYDFSGVLQHDAILPYYKGSTFRGIFGIALKKVVCALRREDCKDCLLRQKCIYSFVFEIPPQEEHNPQKTRIAAPPHPYVIEPPLTTRTAIKEGESFDFSLLLFGRANEYLPYFIYAFEHMGKIGIGKKINGIRSQFLLESVRANGCVIYSNKTRQISSENYVENLTKDNWLNPVPEYSSFTLHLKTPLRVKFQNRLKADLPFHVLIRAALRRISSLCTYHGDGEPTLDYRGLVKRSEAVKIAQSDLRWYDWKRYSNRQEQSMLMGGMIGSVAYSGDLGEFVPLLRFCEKVHIGKQTSFGLGQIEITVQEP